MFDEIVNEVERSIKYHSQLDAVIAILDAIEADKIEK
jgi:hypothetical protein